MARVRPLPFLRFVSFALTLLSFVGAVSLYAGSIDFGGGGGSGTGSAGSGSINTSTADIIVTNRNDAVTLYTSAITGGVLGTNQCVDLEVLGLITGNNTVGLTIAATYAAAATSVTYTPTTGTNEGLSIKLVLCADGATNVQKLSLTVISGATGQTRNALGALAVDSTLQHDVVITAQWASTSAAVSLTKSYAHTIVTGGASWLNDPGTNGVLKRTAQNVTGIASAGTDYVMPSGSITGNAATSTAFDHVPVPCANGQSGTGILANGNTTGCVDIGTQAELDAGLTGKQAANPNLTTLAGKTIVSPGTDLRMSTGSFAANDLVKVDASGNFISVGKNETAWLLDPGGTPTGILKRTAPTITQIAIAGTDFVLPTGSISGNAATSTNFDHTPTLCANGSTPLGITTAGNVTGCFDVATQLELDAVSVAKQNAAASLTTLSSKTVLGTGSDVRLSTGSFTPNDLVKVDASGAFTSAGPSASQGLADPGNPGIVKRTTPNATQIASAGTDYVVPSGSITGNAATSTNFDHIPVPCAVGQAGTGIVANGNATGCIDIATQAESDAAIAGRQPLSTTLTTVAGKTLIGAATGTDLRFSTGTFLTNDMVKVDTNGNFISAGPGGSAGLNDPGTNGIVKRIALNTTQDAKAGIDFVAPGGSILGNAGTASAFDHVPVPCSAGQAGTGILANGASTGCVDIALQTELDTGLTGKQPISGSLTTLGTKNVLGNGSDVRLSTGTFTANDLVKVDASGNLISGGQGVAIGDGDKGDVIVSGTGTVWTVDTGVITNAKLATMPTANFKGRVTAGTGAPEDLTGTQATGLLDVFTTSAKGLVPAPGASSTTNYLRADGTWAAPAGAGGGPSTDDMQAVADRGRTINNATSPATAFRVGGTTNYLLFYNGTVGLNPVGDFNFQSADNFSIGFQDAAATDMLRINEADKTATFSGLTQVTNQGVEFTNVNTIFTCSVGKYAIYPSRAAGKFKQCVNGVESDLGTASDTTTPTVSSCSFSNVRDTSFNMTCTITDPGSSTWTAKVRYCTSAGCTAGGSGTATAPVSCGATCTVNVTGLQTWVNPYYLRMDATDAGLNTGSSAENQQATPKVYYVAQSGSNGNSCTTAHNSGGAKQTIANAVACLNPGETLLIRGGTYAEMLNDSIPSGTSWAAPVTVQAYYGETVTLQPAAGVDGVIWFSGNDTQYIEIRDLHLHAAQSTPIRIGTAGTPVFGNAAHHIRIRNCEMWGGAGGGGSGNGITIRPFATDNEIIGGSVHDNGTNNLDHGIYIEDDRNVVDGVTIYNNQGYGVHVYTSPPGDAADNNVIKNSIIYSNMAFGILLGPGTGSKAWNNILYDNGGGISMNNGGQNSSAWNNTIHANVVKQSLNPGGTFKQYDGNCIFMNNTSGSLSQNNICYQNAINTVFVAGGAGSESFNMVSGNPLFTDATNHDYTLSSNSSPAVGTGTSRSGDFTTDIIGTPRPQGTNWDKGAYERIGGTLMSTDLAVTDCVAGPLRESTLDLACTLRGTLAVRFNTHVPFCFGQGCTPGQLTDLLPPELRGLFPSFSPDAAPVTIPSLPTESPPRAEIPAEQPTPAVEE